MGEEARDRFEWFGTSRYTYDAVEARLLSTDGNAEIGSASSASRYCTTSSGEVFAPSHFSFAESVPAEKRRMRYPRGQSGRFSSTTAASGSSKPVRYQKSEAWRNL